ncbi:RrF2 family transcriptional regulator [Actinospongicola halichondriae]|uniref:RrF2 family transcriptional regulator n=1 Tax=Actinospongicola halichondriae TaxID=3236844 RepID=UPI003D566C77
MRMSEGVEWAIHSCTMLAFVPDDQALPAGKLAEFHGVPPAYLAKHLQALVRAGICSSVPGPRGGFRLARPAEEITLLDITLAVDGEGTAFRCSEIRQRGPASQDDPSCYRDTCSIALAMWRAEDAWRAELRRVTLAEIGGNLASVVDPRQLTESAVWLDQTLNRGAST